MYFQLPMILKIKEMFKIEVFQQAWNCYILLAREWYIWPCNPSTSFVPWIRHTCL